MIYFWLYEWITILAFIKELEDCSKQRQLSRVLCLVELFFSQPTGLATGVQLIQYPSPNCNS